MACIEASVSLGNGDKVTVRRYSEVVNGGLIIDRPSAPEYSGAAVLDREGARLLVIALKNVYELP